MKCELCGKDIDFSFYDPFTYVYKIVKRRRNSTDTKYYCGFNCRSKALKLFAIEEEKKKKETAEKRRQTLLRNRQKLIDAKGA